MRASDALLLFGEAALESGKSLTDAKWALEEVRGRARRMAADATVLPQFPAYNGYSDTPDDLRKAIRHERRMELAMEGHRWFDLCLLGRALRRARQGPRHLRQQGVGEVRAEMANFIVGRNELFTPFPPKSSTSIPWNRIRGIDHRALGDLLNN